MFFVYVSIFSFIYISQKYLLRMEHYELLQML